MKKWYWLVGVVSVFLSLSSPALSQGNPQCPTRPSTDSSNACASTRFVQNILGASYLFAANFGVVTSGTIDSTIPLQNAITACGQPRAANPTFTGSTILYLPVGNINISDEITSSNSCIVVGMGSGTPLTPISGNVGGTQITQLTSGKGIFTFSTQNSVQVHDLSMVLPVGSVAGAAIKITVPNSAVISQLNYNSRISNVTIHGGYIGIWCLICWNFSAHNNYIDGAAYTGILLQSNPLNTDAGIVTLHGNTILGLTTSDSCVLMIPQSNVTIDGSHKCNSSLHGYHLVTNGSGSGSGIVSGTFQVFGGSLENQENHSIYIEQLVSGTIYGQIIISGVQFLTLAASTAYRNSIAVKAGTGPFINNNYIAKLLINNSLIIQQGGSNGYSVIDVASTEEVQINNNRIDCASLPNCDGIKVDANSRDLHLIENRIKNVTQLYRINVANNQEVLLVDRNGIIVTNLNAQLGGANAFPRVGSVIFVTDGTAATAPVVTGGLGCYAFYRNGVWACP